MATLRMAPIVAALAPWVLGGCQFLWTYDDYGDARGAGGTGTGGAGLTTSGGGDGGSKGLGGAGAGQAAGGRGGAHHAGGGSGGAPAGGAGGAGGSEPGKPDPNADGPYGTDVLEDPAFKVDGDTVGIHCSHPVSGPSSGPYPIVLLARELGAPAGEYDGYAERLATFGYVALVVDYPAPPALPNHARSAKGLAGGIDWVVAHPSLQGDLGQVGVAGHGLGGKFAFLAATLDPRIKAAFGIDPTDGNAGLACGPSACIDVSDAMPTLTIPTGMLGETGDTVGAVPPPCAPKADNFETFYASAKGPTFSVEVLGANHWSFLDSGACKGCLGCTYQAASLGGDVVTALAKAYTVAFFERHLRGDADYDTYITGPLAQQRYVATKLATITSK